jgi:hypothetical protein
VRRHSTPSNRLYECALLVACDAPRYSQWCVPAHIAAGCTEPGPASIPSEDCDADAVVFVAALDKEVEPPPPADRAPRDPGREVLAMLTRRTWIELPEGRTWAPLDAARFRSSELEGVLHQFAVQAVSKSMPCFDLADTLCTRRDGSTFRCTDWSLLYTFLTPSSGTAERLVEALSALPIVVYAERNGWAVPADLEMVTVTVPNPLRPGAALSLDVPRSEHVAIEVYDVRGRRVRRLQHGAMTAGVHEVVWDGCDDGGRVLRSGVFLVRVTAAGRTVNRKAVLLR